jgi:hypothetical protein
VDQPEYESKIKSLRAELGEERFAATWDEGRALTLEQASLTRSERNLNAVTSTHIHPHLSRPLSCRFDVGNRV